MGTAEENAMPAESGEIEIDLGEILGIIAHKLWLILIIAFLCGGISFAFSKFVLPKEYESTTKIYVLDKDSADNSSVYTDLQVGSQLTKDYAQLITSRYVLETVIERLGLEDIYDYDEFYHKVAVNTPTDTRIVAITVTDTDPATAQKMADLIREVSSEHIETVMDIDAVNVVEEANYPEDKSSPSCSLWTIAGTAAGFILTAAFFVIYFLIDDSIKTSEDVEKYLGLSSLGIIPFDENVTNDIGSSSNMKASGNKKKKASDEKTQPAVQKEHKEENLENIV